MRSQLMMLSMISLAVAGCGKDVQKSGAIAGQVNPTGVLGQCADPIAPPQMAAISRFSDLAKPGVYQLVSFEAVGSAFASGQPMNQAPQAQAVPVAAGGMTGISVVVGSMQANGQPTYSQRCQDMSGMPASSYSWNVSAPAQVSAENGAIAEMVAFRQTLHGPQAPGNTQQTPAAGARVSIEMAQGCRSADAAIRGEGCSASTYYQLDANTIGVLRMTEAREMNGALVRTKIFAKYVLAGSGNQPMNPMPPSDMGDGFGSAGSDKDGQFGEWDSGDDTEYSGTEKSERQEQPSKKAKKLPPVNPANKKLLPSGKGGNGQGIDPSGNGQGIDPVVIRAQPEVRTIVGVVYPHSHRVVKVVKSDVDAIVVSKEKSDIKVKIDTDGDAKVKLKDKDKSKVKSTTETVTVTKAADGSVSTATSTTTSKAKSKSKTKIKAKKD